MQDDWRQECSEARQATKLGKMWIATRLGKMRIAGLRLGKMRIDCSEARQDWDCSEAREECGLQRGYAR